MGSPRRACVDCHFFVQEYRDEGSGQPHCTGIEQEHRELARRNDYSWHKWGSLRCHFLVWDEGYQFDPDRRHEVIVKSERAGFCFFWPWRPGMLFPAARVLQEREALAREATRDRRLTQIGLFIAAAALIANLVVTLVK